MLAWRHKAQGIPTAARCRGLNYGWIQHHQPAISTSQAIQGRSHGEPTLGCVHPVRHASSATHHTGSKHSAKQQQVEAASGPRHLASGTSFSNTGRQGDVREDDTKDHHCTLPWQQRTQLLVGSDGLQKLRAARVLIVGVGGVGSYVAEFLAR